MINNYNNSSQQSIKNELEIKLKALSIVDQCFKDAGIKTEDPYKTLKEGLVAVKVSVNKFGVESVDNDYSTRHKYMCTALELMGHLKKNVDMVVEAPRRQMSPEELLRLGSFVSELQKLNDILTTNPIQRGEVIDVTLYK